MTCLGSAHLQKVDEWSPGAGSKRKWGVTANGHGVSFWGDENVLELDHGDGSTTL